MRLVLLSTLCLLVFSSAFAQNNEIDKGLYKLSKREFIAKYNTDDTTKAMINMFFRKRKAGTTQLLGIPIAFGVMVTANFLAKDSDQDTQDQVRQISAISASIPAVAMGIGSISNFGVYTRKKLYQSLEEYTSGKGLNEYVLLGFKKKDFK